MLGRCGTQPITQSAQPIMNLKPVRSHLQGCNGVILPHDAVSPTGNRGADLKGCTRPIVQGKLHNGREAHQRGADEKDRVRVSETDPDARVMKQADGAFVPSESYDI
jgi:hypothetical protein